MADEKENAASKSAAEAEKDRVKARDEQLKEERKVADEVTDAQLERQAAVQPTPTQAENDRARLGQTVDELDDKEDHGGIPEEDLARSTLAGGPAGYSTRSTSPKK